jgi:hypothetical protein
MEACYHARCDVNGQSEPWALQGPPVLGGDNHHIAHHVVDLYQAERPILRQSPTIRPNLLRAWAAPICIRSTSRCLRTCKRATTFCSSGRPLPFSAARPNLAHESRHAWAASIEINLADRGFGD